MDDSRPLALMMAGVICGALLGFALFECRISNNFIWTVTLLASTGGVLGLGGGMVVLAKRRQPASNSTETLARLGMGAVMLSIWIFLYGFYGVPAFFRGDISWQLLIDPALYALITLSFFASVLSLKFMRVLGVMIIALLLAAFFARQDSSKLAFQLFVGIGFSIWCFRSNKVKEPPGSKQHQLNHTLTDA
jgi:hypothetical protein